MNWDTRDFEEMGLLHGVYIEAFDFFLKTTGIEKPNNLLHPSVGLFLLVCDLSINPTNGFPLDIYDFENFIHKNDPGQRFLTLCIEIGKKSYFYIEF